jgi:outer membrane lipoprotein-sorting protein
MQRGKRLMKILIVALTGTALGGGGLLAQGAPLQLTPGGVTQTRPAAPANQGTNVPVPPQRPSAPAQAAPVQRPPAATAPAQAARGVGNLSGSQVATLQRINEVFNGIREMNGRFTQIDGDGSRSTGRFYLTKPGRIRFVYDRPSSLDIIADGTDVVVRDRRLNTQDLYPLSQTPLRYLTNDRVDLVRDAHVVNVFNDQDMVSVTIEERGNFAEGQLTLFFDSTTFALRQWTIVDGRGSETAVAVSDLATNQRNNPQLFAIDRTQMQGPRGN